LNRPELSSQLSCDYNISNAWKLAARVESCSCICVKAYYQFVYG